VLGLALPQVSIIINRMFATYLGEGQLTAISNANRLMQVPLGIFAQAMAVAIFPTLSAQAAQKRFEDLRATASLGIRSILFLTIPSSLIMIVLARPIVALLLQHGRFTASDTDITATALIFYSIGIFAWSAQSILSRGFYAMQDTVTPVVIGTSVTLVFVPMNWLFMTPLGLGYVGLCLATTVAATLHAVIMMLLLRRRLGGIEGKRVAITVGKTLLASLLATAACWAAFRLFGAISPAGTAGIKIHALLTLLVGLAAGAAVYVLSALLLRIEEMKHVTGILQRRRRAGQ
jgi:putative peptidoglycan lipid II flippase